MKLTGQKCLCRACGSYFRSVAAFDRHRGGTHGVDRRCLTDTERLAKGMAKNSKGLWVTSLRDITHVVSRHDAA